MWLGIAIMLVVLGLIVWATTRKSRLGHWARVAVMFMSGGFVFPHAMNEDDDIAKNDADKGAKIKKQ
ncbi:MAG: hypothetical protein WCO26_08430 [Deltaproteobacteria bacterium]